MDKSQFILSQGLSGLKGTRGEPGLAILEGEKGYPGYVKSIKVRR
jgi:hypothetical protein